MKIIQTLYYIFQDEDITNIYTKMLSHINMGQKWSKKTEKTQLWEKLKTIFITMLSIQ